MAGYKLRDPEGFSWYGKTGSKGRLITNLMASLAEFEHDLLRERVQSGIAAAKAKGRSCTSDFQS